MTKEKKTEISLSKNLYSSNEKVPSKEVERNVKKKYKPKKIEEKTDKTDKTSKPLKSKVLKSVYLKDDLKKSKISPKKLQEVEKNKAKIEDIFRKINLISFVTSVAKKIKSKKNNKKDI